MALLHHRVSHIGWSVSTVVATVATTVRISAISAMARKKVSSLEPAILLHWPAMELQFFHALPADKRQILTEKWLAAGGKIYGCRLIALKNDPVWRVMTGAKRLKGEARRFMIFRGCDVTRKECVALGLILPTEILEPTAFDELAPAFLTRKYSRAIDGPM